MRVTSIGKTQLFCLAFFFLAASCRSAEPPASSAAPQFGVAVRTGSSICLSIQGRPLEPKTVVAVVNTSDPQSSASLTIVEPSVSACPGIKPNQSSYKSYRARIVDGSIEEDMPLIALVAPASPVEILRGTAQEHIGGADHPAMMFRSCTSSDGVHLSVWEGKPLAGKRVWHQYYYLGQDLEANCTRKDFAQ